MSHWLSVELCVPFVHLLWLSTPCVGWDCCRLVTLLVQFDGLSDKPLAMYS